jgi:hypothetical protein
MGLYSPPSSSSFVPPPILGPAEKQLPLGVTLPVDEIFSMSGVTGRMQRMQSPAGVPRGPAAPGAIGNIGGGASKVR